MELITLENAAGQQVRRWGPTGPITTRPEPVGWGGPVIARGSKLHWVTGDPVHWMEYDFDAHEMRYLKVLEGIYPKNFVGVRSSELSPDASQVAVYTDGGMQVFGLQVFALETGKPLLTVPIADGTQPRGLGWSHDGSYLAASDSSGRCTIYDGKKLQIVREVTGIRDADIAWAKHAPLLATGDGRIIGLDGHDDRKLSISCDRLDWSTDGRYLAIYSLGNPSISEIVEWDVASDREVARFRQRLWNSNAMIWPRGLSIVTWSTLEGGPNSIWFTDPQANKHSALFLRPDGKHVIMDSSGRYRGSGELDEDFVNVVLTESGFKTIKPSEFQARFGWKNQPNEVRLW
jgi:hypothetical protein